MKKNSPWIRFLSYYLTFLIVPLLIGLLLNVIRFKFEYVDLYFISLIVTIFMIVHDKLYKA